MSKKSGLTKKEFMLLREVLAESLSEEHVKVIEKLSKPQYDEDLAEKLKVKATVVRTLLNDLHAVSLVEYDRAKNKKTGWYTYLWKKRDDKIKEHTQNFLTNKLESLNKELEKEKVLLGFKCECGNVPFEEALEENFYCNDCDQNFVEYDNSESIDRLVGQIARINGLVEQNTK